jgi:hypothetical protein
MLILTPTILRLCTAYNDNNNNSTGCAGGAQRVAGEIAAAIGGVLMCESAFARVDYNKNINNNTNFTETMYNLYL